MNNCITFVAHAGLIQVSDDLFVARTCNEDGIIEVRKACRTVPAQRFSASLPGPAMSDVTVNRGRGFEPIQTCRQRPRFFVIYRKAFTSSTGVFKATLCSCNRDNWAVLETVKDLDGSEMGTSR